MTNGALSGDLAVAPLAPLGIAHQQFDGSALIGDQAPEPLSDIRSHVAYNNALRASPDVKRVAPREQRNGRSDLNLRCGTNGPEPDNRPTAAAAAHLGRRCQ